jgi:hypothetical protein
MQRESEMSTETTVAPEAETQNPASELAETPEVATPEAETPETEEQTQKPEEDPRERALKRMERRFGRITAARHQAEAQLQSERQEAEQLRQRLSQYESGNEPEQRQQADPVALARQIVTLEKVTEKSNSVINDGKKRFEGFDKAIAVVMEETGGLFNPVAPGARVGLPNAIGEAILDADDPAAVLHYLGNNPDAAADLAGLTATQVARRIARIEFDLSKPKEPKQSNAPKALTPVKSTTKDDGGLSDNLSPEEWAKRFYKMRRGG